jgi:hypothetical protein
MKLKYDFIGYWSEIKLDIIREYATAYSKIVSAEPSITSIATKESGDGTKIINRMD